MCIRCYHTGATDGLRQRKSRRIGRRSIGGRIPDDCGRRLAYYSRRSLVTTPGESLLIAEGKFLIPSKTRDDEVSWGEPLAILPPFRPHHKVVAGVDLSRPEPADDEVGGEEAGRETWGD